MVARSERRAPHGGRWRGLAPLILAFALACTPNDPARAGEPVAGRARDADTNEPIVGAWIFETHRKPGAGEDVFHVAKLRTARSDANGDFAFENGRFGFAASYPPVYQFYHPSYGLIRGRADETGRMVEFRPSLRDAHLRQADATAYCNARSRNEMTERIAEMACPPSKANLFPDGSPRATGALDDRGRREGPWIFFREDGSVIARGRYSAGAATGDWRFEAPTPTAVAPD